jgi:hypothetical protein
MPVLLGDSVAGRPAPGPARALDVERYAHRDLKVIIAIVLAVSGVT